MNGLKWGLVVVIAAVMCGCQTAPVMRPVFRPENTHWHTLSVEQAKLSADKLKLKSAEEQLATANRRAAYFQAPQTIRLMSQLSKTIAGEKNKTAIKAISHTQKTNAKNTVARAKHRVAKLQTKVENDRKRVAAANRALGSQRKAFMKSYNNTILRCQKVINSYHSRSRLDSRAAFWVQVSGLVAGAVVAPALVAAASAANKAWIAGLSGYAGATNLAETSLGNANLNGISQANTANRIVARIRKDIVGAQSGTDWGARYDALMKVVSDCTLIQIGVPQLQPNNNFGQETGGSTKTSQQTSTPKKPKS